MRKIIRHCDRPVDKNPAPLSAHVSVFQQFPVESSDRCRIGVIWGRKQGALLSIEGGYGVKMGRSGGRKGGAYFEAIRPKPLSILNPRCATRIKQFRRAQKPKSAPAFSMNKRTNGPLAQSFYSTSCTLKSPFQSSPCCPRPPSIDLRSFARGGRPNGRPERKPLEPDPDRTGVGKRMASPPWAVHLRSFPPHKIRGQW